MSVSINLAEFAESIRTGLVDAVATISANQKPAEKNYAHAPEAFDGARSHYRVFRRTLVGYAKAIPAPRSKIYAALSFMTKGDADSFAQLYSQEHQTEIDDGSITWDRFLADLDKKFLDPRLGEYARADILVLQQGRLEADAFFLKFDELRIDGNLTDTASYDEMLVELLQKNMNPAVVLSVKTAFEAEKGSLLQTIDFLDRAKTLPGTLADALALANKPISYDRFRTLAIAADPIVRRHGYRFPTQPASAQSNDRRRLQPAVHYQSTPNLVQAYQNTGPPPLRSTQSQNQNQGHSTSNQNHSAPARAEPDVMPMDIDRQRFLRSRLCYRCKKPGHIARNCQESDLREVVRGLTDEDLDEIVRLRAQGAKAVTIEGPAEEDFSIPQ